MLWQQLFHPEGQEGLTEQWQTGKNLKEGSPSCAMGCSSGRARVEETTCAKALREKIVLAQKEG